MTKKLIYAVVAIGVLVGSAAYAGDPSYPGAIERGTAGIVFAPGVPFITPFVSDRSTAVRQRSNFQPGPIHELGPDDKVQQIPR